ncbi:MAG TPA: DUF411 domain-containing protein [Gemmatimonadales bacterium]|nr:DUF411 domain-containing protein [Gemmatimonadales bacterium]
MSELISRRALLATGFNAAAAAVVFPALLRPASPIPMMVYKDPGCGCCKTWVSIMRSAGFEVSAKDTSDMQTIKTRYKVPAALASCHTALVGGYVIEGHVPADLITKLLKDKPKVLGLAVPGMVTGSPGMEGSPKQAYDVVTFDAAGKTTVYARR